MRTQFPVSDTSTVSTARATSTGCFLLQRRLTDTAEILRNHRTQPLSFAFWLQPYIPDCHGAKAFLELWEFLWFPHSTGRNTKCIIHRLKPLFLKILNSELLLAVP